MTRQILTTGHRVHPIGLGCMNFCGFYGPGDEDEALRTLAAARDHGIDFFDTANVYGMGRSEQILGRFLGGRAEGVTLATKAGIWRTPEGKSLGFNNKPDHLRAELEASLSRLGLERVDLFYIHRRDPEVAIEEVMGTLLDLKNEGKTGGIGFSEISPASLRRAAAMGPVDAVQSELSLSSRQPELGMIQATNEIGAALVAYAPLGRGLFADPPPDPDRFEAGDWRLRNPRFQPEHYPANLAALAPFQSYAADHGWSTAALAIAWVLARSGNIIPIPGTRSAAHLADWARAADIRLTAFHLAEIDRLLPIGWAHGDRYGGNQRNGTEGYC